MVAVEVHICQYIGSYCRAAHKTVSEGMFASEGTLCNSSSLVEALQQLLAKRHLVAAAAAMSAVEMVVVGLGVQR